MTTDEAARLHLYERARSAMDDEAARTLMSALPWDVAELVTKQDLSVVEARLQSKIDSTARSVVFSMIAANAAMAGLAFALAQVI